MMASLRARLLAAVLALTACGLLLVGAITYAEQRSFQYDRVDQQLRASVMGVAHELDRATGGCAGRLRRPDDRGRPAAGARPNFGIPAGTYGQKRDASGRVLGGQAVSPATGTVTAKPALPAKVPIGDGLHRRRPEGRGTRYRALAVRDPMDGASPIVAIPLTRPTRRCSACSSSRRW